MAIPMEKPKTPKENTRADVVTNIINTAKNFRSMYEPQWYVNYNAYENNHFVVWLPQSRQIKRIPMKGNKFFNQIPELHKQVDTTQNMLLSAEMIPIVYPVKMDVVSTYWASKIEDYLMYLYRHWMFLGVLHDAVHDALVMPVSFLQLLPPETNDGKMEILELDATDVFVPPGIKDVQSKQCNYVGKSVKRPLEEIHNSKIYNDNRLKVQGTQSWSSSIYKEMLMSERYGYAGASSEKEATAVVDELWIKEWKDGEMKVSVITSCEGMVLRDEVTSYDRLPFVSVKLHQGLLYQPSFVEYLLPINRGIDLFQSRMEDMGLKMVRSALLVPNGANINRTTDENGERVDYRPGFKPEIMPVPELPPFFTNYINMQFGWMERYGASAVTMGSSPKGVKTYRTVEAVRQQDYASLKTPMDFMKIALTQLFNLVIYFASIYYLEPVNVKIYEQEDYNVFDVLGEKGIQFNTDKFPGMTQSVQQMVQNQPQDDDSQGQQQSPQQAGQPQQGITGQTVQQPMQQPMPQPQQTMGQDQDPLAKAKQAPVVIHQDNVVEIEFETAQSYTMEGKRQTIYQAVQAGLLPKEYAIRMLKLGNVRDIMEALDKEVQKDLQKQAQQAAIQQQQQKQNGQQEGQQDGQGNLQNKQPNVKSKKAQEMGQPNQVLGEVQPGQPIGTPGIRVGQ